MSERKHESTEAATVFQRSSWEKKLIKWVSQTLTQPTPPGPKERSGYDSVWRDNPAADRRSGRRVIEAACLGKAPKGTDAQPVDNSLPAEWPKIRSLMDLTMPDDNLNAGWLVARLAPMLETVPPETASRFLTELAAAKEMAGRRLSVREALQMYTRMLSPDAAQEAIDPAIWALLRREPSLRLSDVHLWRELSEVDRRLSRAALVDELSAAVRPGTERTDREAVESKPSRTRLESLRVPDLQRLRLLEAFIASKAGREQITQLIARDLAAKDTELGGLVELRAGQVAFVSQAPSSRGDNGRYVWHRSYTRETIATFHLHATSAVGSPTMAGPSCGDLQGIAGREFDDVVITFLGGRRFNVDFYVASGVVVDLGTFEMTRIMVHGSIGGAGLGSGG